jgi:hypothetical protein
MIVEVHGVEVFGHHGVGEQERRQGQTFLVDVTLQIPEPSVDVLTGTIDYRRVRDIIHAVNESGSFSSWRRSRGASPTPCTRSSCRSACGPRAQAGHRVGGVDGGYRRAAVMRSVYSTVARDRSQLDVDERAVARRRCGTHGAVLRDRERLGLRRLRKRGSSRSLTAPDARRAAPPRGRPGAVEVDGILAAVEVRARNARDGRARQRLRAAGNNAVRLDLGRCSFGSCGSRAACGTRARWDVEQPVARCVVEARCADVDGRAPHDLEQLRVVEVGRSVQTHAAAPATSGDEKLVPGPRGSPTAPVRSGSATGMRTPGATRSTVGASVENDATRPLSFDAPDGQHVGIAAGISLRAPLEALVAGRRDDERARPEREHDGVLEQRVLVLAAEAEVDHAGPSRAASAMPWIAAPSLRIPNGLASHDAQHRVGIDADDPDAVVRCADHGATSVP